LNNKGDKVIKENFKKDTAISLLAEKRKKLLKKRRG